MSWSKLKIFFLIFLFFLHASACTQHNQISEVAAPDTLVIGVKSLPSKFKISRLIERKLSRLNERFEMVPDALENEGPGPFEIIEQTTSSLKLKNRHDPAMPVRLEFVEFKVIEDDNLRALALKNRKVDAVQNDMQENGSESLPSALENSLRQDSHLKFQSTEGAQTVYIKLNLEDRWISQLEVRQALAYALDPSSFVAYFDRVTPADTLLPLSHWAYEKEVSVYKSENVKRARELVGQALIKAGYKPEDSTRRLTLQLQLSSREMPVARWMAKCLGKVGIDLHIDSDMSGPQKNYQMFLTTTPEPSWALSEPVFLNELYQQETYQQLTASLAQAADVKSRKEIYSWMQKILSQDLPVIPLWYVKNRIIYQETMDHVRLRPDGSYEWILEVSKRSL